MNALFGGELIKLKRAESHRKATELIWVSLLKELIAEEVKTWEALLDLINKPANRPKFKPLIDSAQRLNTPHLPGVYSFWMTEKE